MKHTKKLLSALLALAMMLVLAVPAFADNTATYSLTINNATAGHTYEAYQVFGGDLSGTTLSNIVWGAGVNGDALLAALNAADTLDTTDFTSAAEVADALSDANATAFAQVAGQHLSAVATSSGTFDATASSYTISGLTAGYYLVKDQDASLTGNDAYTSFILKVVGDAEAAPKSAVPTVEKKVKENVKYTGTEYGAGYNDVADYNIGDIVPFELIGTLPTNYASYTTYNYVFTDTASAGLTQSADGLTVTAYLNGTITDEANGNAVSVTGSFAPAIVGQVLTVSCTDLKAITGLTSASKIVVRYNATLNADAVIGLDGNPNEVYLTYSNNPNQGGSGDNGQTPTDKVIVFTYELDTTKVDATNAETKLKDAEFKLYKEVTTTVDDVETTTKKYAVVDDAGKVTGWTATEASASTLKSGEDGMFKVIGLDDGVYYLQETKAPAGYNLLTEAIKLTITATTANNQTWAGTASDALTALSIAVNNGNAVSGVTQSGIVSTTVQNNKGATLPSTGGMGTTLFTIGGIVLMVGAGVVLVARRKMHSEDK